MQRVVGIETLDHLAPDDPAAVRSRRDLVRVHRVMRTRQVVRAAWQALVAPDRARAPLRILELGAGDGSLLLGVARALAPRWPAVQLTLLDRQDIVSRATLDGYAALGWTASVRRADVLAWAADDEGAAGAAPARWDLISTALFLHHFATDPLKGLLAAIAARCERFFACEPRRDRWALAASHAVAVLGANAVTREDAVLSVRAGFRGDEIGALWPRGDAAWRWREAAAAPFSHCFSAWRVGAAR
jgi:hypothetical protein